MVYLLNNARKVYQRKGNRGVVTVRKKKNKPCPASRLPLPTYRQSLQTFAGGKSGLISCTGQAGIVQLFFTFPSLAGGPGGQHRLAHNAGSLGRLTQSPSVRGAGETARCVVPLTLCVTRPPLCFDILYFVTLCTLAVQLLSPCIVI